MRESHSAREMGLSEISRARKSLENIIESAKQAEQRIQLIAKARTRQTSPSGQVSESAGHLSLLSIENTRREPKGRSRLGGC